MQIPTKSHLPTELEEHFRPFRKNIVGVNQEFESPYGWHKILYADWIASGRLYHPIEEKLHNQIGKYVANTHTETSYTGTVMTKAYERARQLIKKHVNATEDDVLITTGTGMTGAVLKFQRILGIKAPEQIKSRVNLSSEERPVVFISHMEHHSNQTSWLETLAEVEQIRADHRGLIDLDHFAELLEKYKDRPKKIVSITAASNVTGIKTPYHEIAKMIHKKDGLCFVDFACSAPYVDMDMHPQEEGTHLDAIFFSPHKFLGGPGSPGILVFNSALYKNKVPDQPGGGTVTWTNPWGGHRYHDDIEEREDGGTPGFMQTLRAAFSIQLKEQMGTDKIEAREQELVPYIMERIGQLPNLHVLADNVQDRVGAISFYVDDLHYNLMVKLLNDLYGIQTRGGCSCAGTYGHYLLHVDEEYSKQITDLIDKGDLSEKPGWVRLSVHPTLRNEEADYLCTAIEFVSQNWQDYTDRYYRPEGTTEYLHKEVKNEGEHLLQEWFS